MKNKIIYNQYYEAFEDFKQAVMGFFENIEKYNPELESLMVEKFQILDISMAC